MIRATLIAMLALAAVAGEASANKADALFKKGKKLLAAKKYAEACTTFEKVDQLDPGIGAKLNVAKCYQEWGKLAIAYRWYLDAEHMAADTKDGRAAKIKELAEELDVNVPRLTIKIPETADPRSLVSLTLDGKLLSVDLLGTEQRVDPGAHVIEYTAGGKKKKKMAPVERGGSSEVLLDVPKAKVGEPEPPTDPTETTPEPGDEQPEEPTQPAPGRNRRIAGIAVASAGGVGIVVASALTLSARSSYKDALAAHCMGSTTMCDPQGLTATHDARHRANIATVISLVGGAAVIGGVVLYLTAPKAGHADEHALYLTPVVGADGGAVVFGGRY